MEVGGVQYYEKIARLYDIMYNEKTGFDYLAQVQWVDNWRIKVGLPPIVLDLACGTGKHLACFESLGYACFGIDASQAMLDIAAKRLTETQLEQGLFHNFELSAAVPLITCFFNALGYNRNLAELGRTLRNIHANLRDNGLLVFDIAFTSSPQNVFKVKEFEGDGYKFSRTVVGIPTAAGYQSTMYLVVFDGTSSEVIEETTLRGGFSCAEIKTALSNCDFTVLYEGSGYYSTGTTTTVFIAQK